MHFSKYAGNLTVLGSGKLRLKNTTSEKSSLIINGFSTGKIQSEYQVIAGQNTLLSSPVDMAVTGTFLSMYLRDYNEPTAQWGEYILPTNDPLQVMRGYELFSLFSETRIFEGYPNHDAKTFTISNSNNGLNLTGNPYPSYIDWENENNNSWERSSIAAAIYYPDPSGSGNFAVYVPGGDDAVSLNNGSRYIPPMQGFFVKASKQGTITAKASSRVRTINDSKNYIKNNSIKFRVSNSDGLSDEVLFRVNANATFGFEDDMDAIKIKGNGNAPSLHLLSDNDIKYAVSTIPTVNSSLEIPLNIECTQSGMYKIASSGAFNFEYRYPVILFDKELNNLIDLRADSVYTFFHTPEMNSDRFEIHFSSPDGIATHQDIQTELIVNNGELKITGSEKTTYTARLITTDGKIVNSAKGLLSDGITLSTSNTVPGIHLVQLFNEKYSITQKVLIY